MTSRLKRQTARPLVVFYHDIEQDLDSDANPHDCRDAVKSFLDLEREYEVRATYNVVGRLFLDQPELVDTITREGQEVAFHSFDHRRDWKPEHSSDQIDRCRSISGSIRGYRSPRSAIDDAGIRRLWEQGFLWNAEGDGQREPYFIHKGLVRLPIETDDWPLHQGSLDPKHYVERFSALLLSRSYLSIGFHDSVTSLAALERLAIWKRLLELAVEAGAQFVTMSEAADLFRRAAVARYYTATAADWNRGTKKLYRTKRFQELVRGEAEKLAAPLVADLGSGGGVVSAPVSDLARAIHCVDNSAGMVTEANSRQGIEGHFGEVTDSNLPAQSFDLVVCVRVIEYLFWPERLANEIRRIGKPGATYLVTFPAFRGDPPPNEGAPPDRIRRYFTAQSIHDWARSVGPGRLVGIQYDSAEPADTDTEEQHRAMEMNPPADRVPTNWVFIGTIAHNSQPDPRVRTLPLSAAPFRFSNDTHRSSRHPLLRFLSQLKSKLAASG